MNEFERILKQAERIKLLYPIGTRIELISMKDPQAVPSGTRGTVDFIDGIGTLHMKWDNGRTLGVVPGEDEFRRLTQEEMEAEQQDGMDEDNSPVQFM